MLRRWGEGKAKVERKYPTGDRPRGVVSEKSPVFRIKTANECSVEARQRARCRSPMAKDYEGEAKERSDEDKRKERLRKRTESV